MPNIEMILVRFNLDKEDDRKAFELLRRHAAPRKRTAFLKKALLQGLAIELGEKPFARMTRKAKRAKGEEPEISGVATSPARQMSGDRPSLSLPDNACAAETDPEVAALIGSIVQ